MSQRRSGADEGRNARGANAAESTPGANEIAAAERNDAVVVAWRPALIQTRR
jgi:hypothetical protein